MPPPVPIDAQVRVEVVADAVVCAVHLHGDEADSRTAMRSMPCANRLEIPLANGKDRMTRRFRAGACDVDPNRVFTAAGRTAQGCTDVLDRWVAEELLPGLDMCRAGGLP